VKLIFAGILLLGLLGAAQAEDAPQAITPGETRPVLTVIPERMGYAVERPEILNRQRLFGLAHGLSLLAAACLDLPAYSRQIEDAYADWHAKQAETIETLVHDLARYYFGSRAAEAEWQDLVRALNLPDNIQPALGEITLHAACASLPAAIVRPRYELDRMLKEGLDPAVEEAPITPVISPPSGIDGPQSGSSATQGEGPQSGIPATQDDAAPSAAETAPAKPAE